MSERIRSILEHMLEDAKDIIVFSKAVSTLEELRKNTLIKKGVVMSLLNIGELANKLSSEFTDEHPQIPWRSMVGMRNFAAHGYQYYESRNCFGYCSNLYSGIGRFHRGDT